MNLEQVFSIFCCYLSLTYLSPRNLLALLPFIFMLAGYWGKETVYPWLPWYAFAVHQEDELFAWEESLCLSDNSLQYKDWYFAPYSNWAFTSSNALFPTKQTNLHTRAWCHNTLDLEVGKSSCMLKWCWHPSTSKSLVRQFIMEILNYRING